MPVCDIYNHTKINEITASPTVVLKADERRDDRY